MPPTKADARPTDADTRPTAARPTLALTASEALDAIRNGTGATVEVVEADADYVTVRLRHDDLDRVADGCRKDEDEAVLTDTSDDAEDLANEVRDAISKLQDGIDILEAAL